MKNGLIISRCGTQRWFKNGKRHREDGPAVINNNNDKYWYRNGLLHRLDGPAIEYSSGGGSWYIKGTYIAENQHDFNQHLIQRNLKALL